MLLSVTGKGKDARNLIMLKAYYNPLLGHQVVERFGIRSFIQEKFLNQPVPPEALLKSDVALPKNDVLENILKDTSMSRNLELSLPDTDPNVPEFQATADRIEANTAEVDVWDPPECLPPEIDMPDDLPV